MEYLCPVCGYPNLRHPTKDTKGISSDEICPSCGFHFGYDDDSEGVSYEDWRKRWKNQGMNWFSQFHKPPPDWNPTEQLKKIE